MTQHPKQGGSGGNPHKNPKQKSKTSIVQTSNGLKNVIAFLPWVTVCLKQDPTKIYTFRLVDVSPKSLLV